MKRVVLVAALLAFNVPIIAAADGPATTSPSNGAPVTLENCHMDYPQLSIGLLPVGKGVGPLHVDFRNEGKQVATEVRFDANLDGHDLIVTDQGTFSPDVQIKHMFKEFGGGMHFLISREPQPTCAVIGVTYADGTTWAAPIADAGTPQLFDQLIGSWKCTTAAGSSVSAAFSVTASGEVDEHMDWTAADGSSGGKWDQTFNYDADSKLWNVKNTGNGLVFSGTTAGADGNVAIVSGVQSRGNTGVPTRERFTFSLPKEFSHAWEQQNADGTWKPTSYAECSISATS